MIIQDIAFTLKDGRKALIRSPKDEDIQGMLDYLYVSAGETEFILRYPEGKEDTTSLPFKPSLFRYVGKENALRMTTLNMCLDQYVIYLNSR